MACTFADLLDNSNCIDEFSERDKLAAQVYYLCKATSDCVATPATCTTDNLQTAVACIKQVSDPKLVSMQVYADYQLAVATGASVSLDKNTLQENIKCFKLLDEHTLRAIVLYLRCVIRSCTA